MANNAQITLKSGNTTIVFTPADYKITYESIASPNSGRTDDGTMSIEWKARQLVKIDITLPPFKVDDPVYQGILSCVQGQEYTLKYYDYIIGNIVSSAENFYTSTTTAGFNTGVVYNGIVTGASFQAIGMEAFFKGSRTPSHITPTTLATPTVTASGHTLSWTAVTNAEFYKIFDNGLYITQTAASYTVPTGLHKVRIQSCADSTHYNDSAWTNEITVA